jgi:hypothetical protein
MATKLAPGEISDLDPCKFMAVMGKRVIHPGGQASTQALLCQARSATPSAPRRTVGSMRAFAGGLAVSRARLGPAVAQPAAGRCASVWSSRFLPAAVESRGPRPITR